MSSINSLKALNRESAEVSKSDLFSVHPELLAEEQGFNVRGAFSEDYFDQPEVTAHIRGFADAYKAGRYVPPIIVQVRDGVPYVRDGMHRRRGLLLAMQEGADIKKVQVLEHRGDEAEQTVLIATSNDGRPLTPLERAVLYGRLEKWGWSDQQIADSVRRTAEHVRQTLALLDLPLALKQMIQRNDVSATYAAELFREHGDQAVNMLRHAKVEVVEQGKTKITRKNVNATNPDQPKAPRMTKKVQAAVRVSVASLTRQLEHAEPVEGQPGRFTLMLSREEIDELLALRESLGIEEDSQAGGENNAQLDLVGSHAQTGECA